MTARRSRDDEPGEDHRHAPEAVGQAAGDGDSANIPNVCALIDEPDGGQAWPCSVMWSGVIVMIRTITTWTVTSATIATGTFGRREDRAERRSRWPHPAARVGRAGLVGELVRVGPEQREGQDGGGADEDDRHEVGAGQRRAGRAATANVAGRRRRGSAR